MLRPELLGIHRQHAPKKKKKIHGSACVLDFLAPLQPERRQEIGAARRQVDQPHLFFIAFRLMPTASAEGAGTGPEGAALEKNLGELVSSADFFFGSVPRPFAVGMLRDRCRKKVSLSHTQEALATRAFATRV